MDMIVRINGSVINELPTVEEVIKSFEVDKMNKRDMKRLKKLSVWLWSISGVMLANTKALAAPPESASLWEGMQQVFGVFQEIGMVLGAFAILGGLIVMIFKRRAAQKIILTAAIAVGGVFLVPAAIMLIAIIGSMMNDVLSNVFHQMDIGNSVKVTG
jgi:energy-converting hydrogenase Eha subunit C